MTLATNGMETEVSQGQNFNKLKDGNWWILPPKKIVSWQIPSVSFERECPIAAKIKFNALISKALYWEF